MKRLQPALAVLVLGLWGCPNDDLPPEYRGLQVPKNRLASIEARDNGRTLFLEHCALCHGVRADGHGVRRNLSTRPQSFNNRTWRDRSTPRKVFFVIREGVQGTPMPAWKTLDEDQAWDLVAYLLTVSDHGP